MRTPDVVAMDEAAYQDGASRQQAAEMELDQKIWTLERRLVEMLDDFHGHDDPDKCRRLAEDLRTYADRIDEEVETFLELAEA